MNSDVRKAHELREDLEEVKRERDNLQRELGRLTAKVEATAHYDYMLSLGQPKERLGALAETLQQLWMECEQDAEICKRVGDHYTLDVLRTTCEGLHPAMMLLRNMGLGRPAKLVLPTKDFLSRGFG